MKKAILAYSGGLDTSYCLVHLSKDKGYEAHALTINTGSFSDEEIQMNEAKALQFGAASFQCIDAKSEFFHSVIRFLIFGNMLKNASYPLSVSAERIVQAKLIVDYARSIGATAIAHGSTGAGNDQVRFDLFFQILAPEMEIITPIRDNQLSREEEVKYLQEHGFSFSSEKSKYSINKGIWGTSVGGAETLTSHLPLAEEAWPNPMTKKNTLSMAIAFEQGIPVALNGETYSDPSALIEDLNEKCAGYGIGRDIHVGDTIIGIKGRVGFEAPAALVLIKAHHALEKHTLSKLQLLQKDQLSIWYANWLHEGLYLDPVMRDMEAFLISSQQKVSGTVHVEIHPGYFSVCGIQSTNDLMSSKAGVYGEMNKAWTADDVKGFIKIYGNSLAIYHHKKEALC